MGSGLISGSPLVTVAIPTYNVEQTLKETLISVVSQTYQNLEILIVDNASTDATVEVAKSVVDPRITVFENESNIGAEANFTRCTALAGGKYTAVFHGDDIYHPRIVEKQTNVLERQCRVGAVFSVANIINSEGRCLRATGVPRALERNPTESREYAFDEIFKALLHSYNFLVCPSAMVRTHIYKEEVGGWRGDLFGTSADLDLWLRIVQKHAIAILPEPMISYRVSTSQETYHINRKRTNRADFFRVIDFYLSQEHVRKLVDREDLRNYSSLERTDRVIRAMNHVLLGEFDAAKNLTGDAINWDIVRDIVSGSRGLKTFSLAMVLRAILSTRIFGGGQRLLNYMKGRDYR